MNFVTNKEKNYNIANPVFIPSAIGIRIGRILSPYVFVSYYLGRMFNILALATMAYFAIKKSKQYAIALFGVSTIPICLWISAGYNYDSFYYGLTLLAISWLINMFDDENKIQLKDIIVYSCLSYFLIFYVRNDSTPCRHQNKYNIGLYSSNIINSFYRFHIGCLRCIKDKINL